MKRDKWVILATLAAVVVLGAAACGEQGVEPTQPPVVNPIITVVVTAPPAEATSAVVAATNTPLPEPTAVPPPTEEPEPPLDLSEIAGLQLDSYRAVTTVTVSGTKSGEQVMESVQVTTEFVREPIAQHMSMTSASTESLTETGTVDIYTVDGMQHMKFGEQWMSSPFTDTASLESEGLLSPSDVLNDACGWENKGKETLDGVRVQHWTMPEAKASECFSSLELGETGELTAAGGDLYVAVDGKYVAKMALYLEGSGLPQFTGSDEVLDSGRMDVTFTMSDVNQPITITVPEAALKASAIPADIPIPPDAVGASQSFGMVTFTSPSSVQVIQDFYAAEMPKYGWTVGDIAELATSSMFTCTKSGKEAAFMISQDPSGTSSVIIAVVDK